MKDRDYQLRMFIQLLNEAMSIAKRLDSSYEKERREMLLKRRKNNWNSKTRLISKKNEQSKTRLQSSFSSFCEYFASF